MTALRDRPLESVQMIDALHRVLAAGLLDPDQQLVVVRVERDGQRQRDVGIGVAGEQDAIACMLAAGYGCTDRSRASASPIVWDTPAPTATRTAGGRLRELSHSGSPSRADTVSRSELSIPDPYGAAL